MSNKEAGRDDILSSINDLKGKSEKLEKKTTKMKRTKRMKMRKSSIDKKNPRKGWKDLGFTVQAEIKDRVGVKSVAPLVPSFVADLGNFRWLNLSIHRYPKKIRIANIN